MKASAWWLGNDIVVQVSGFKSSTASTYINGTTGISCHVWKVTSTASTTNRLTTAAQALTYVSGSNGNYRAVFQSTSAVNTAITTTVRGMIVISAAHSGLNAQWRPHYRGEYRGST